MADAGTGSSARYSFDRDTRDGWGNGQDAMRVGAPGIQQIITDDGALRTFRARILRGAVCQGFIRLKITSQRL